MDDDDWGRRENERSHDWVNDPTRRKRRWELEPSPPPRKRKRCHIRGRSISRSPSPGRPRSPDRCHSPDELYEYRSEEEARGHKTPSVVPAWRFGKDSALEAFNEAAALRDALKGPREPEKEEEDTSMPMPMVAPSGEKKKEAELLIPAPPEARDKQHNQQGVGKLRKAREEVEARKKQQQEGKTPAAPEANESGKKAPVTLETICLDLTEANKNDLVRNLKILSKAAGAKREQLRKLPKFVKLLEAIVHHPGSPTIRGPAKAPATNHPSGLGEVPPQVCDLMCRIIGELAKGDDAAAAIQWVMGEESVALKFLVSMVFSKADTTKIAALEVLPKIAALGGNGKHGRVLRAHLGELRFPLVVHQLKTSNPKQAVMDAVRTCLKEVEPLGLT